MIHVSQLKKHVPSAAQVSTDLSAVAQDSSDDVPPVALLERKWVAHAGVVAARVKI